MKQLWCCMKKDSIEFIRKKRGAAFSSVLILISAMVLISSVILPVLADFRPCWPSFFRRL